MWCSSSVHCLVCSNCTDWIQTENNCFCWQTALLKTSHLSSVWQVTASCVSADSFKQINKLFFGFLDWLDNLVYFNVPAKELNNWKKEANKAFRSLKWVLITSVLVLEALTLESICLYIIRTTSFRGKDVCFPQENKCSVGGPQRKKEKNRCTQRSQRRGLQR